MPDAPTFAADEVYDRQIRLWGLEAQSRMQNSRVLFVGMRALQAEVCKNIVLAGINVTLMDYRPVTHVDLASNFYLREEHVGKNRAEACLPGVKEMNPLADVRCHTESPADVPDDFFTQFDIICASDIDTNTMVRLDKICRTSKKCFMYTDTFGFDGLTLIDLGTHTVLPEGEKGQKKELTFPPIEDVLKAPWSSLKDRWPVSRVFVSGRLLSLFETKYGRRPTLQEDAAAFLELSHQALKDNGLEPDFISDDVLRRLAQVSMAELSPTCAVVGGIIGQEVLKAISLKGEPAFNCFVWDGQTQEGRVLAVPKP